MIQIKNLNKTHHNRGENQVKALTDINIDFDETGVTFIAGASGNGKSTLLSLIGGIDKYSKGEILVDGVDLKTLTPKQIDSYRNSYVDFIIQENTLIPSLTVAENVRLEKAINGQYASDEEVNEALEIVGLKDYGGRMPAEISGGEKRRVAVARTLLMNTKVILVDEPTASLDKANAEIIWNVLKKYSENHLIIAITHNTAEIDKYGDRVITLDKGKIVDDKRISRKKPEEKREIKKLDKSLEKSALGIKQTAKLSYSYLTGKKASFTFVTLLSVLSLLFFSVFFILDGYNYNKVLAYAVKESDTPYVAFVHGSSDSSLPINDKLSDKIIDDFRDNNLNILSNFKDMAKVNYMIEFGPNFYSSNVQNFTIKGLLEVEDEVGEYNSIGQKVLSGAYPQTESEVVISDYFAELLKKYGAFYNNSGTKAFSNFEGTDQDTYAGLIGKEIATNYGYIKISGVYETDYRKFVNDQLAFRGYNAEEFNFKLNYIYSVLHTTSGYISNYAAAHPSVGGLVATIEKDSANGIVTKDLTATTIESSSKNIYLQTGLAMGDVKATDIIISVGLYNALVEGLEGYSQLTPSSYAGGVVAFGLEEATRANLSLKIALNNCEPIIYTIVGVYDDVQDNVEILFTQDRYESDILKQTTFSTNTKVLYTKVGNADIEKAIDILDNKDFTYVSINSENITNYGERISVMKSAFLIASIFMAIYSLVLMYYFISQIIIDKKNDIGVLKTLGCGKKDIASIFILCSATIALMIFLITVLFTFAIAAICNVVVVSQIPVTISVFAPSGMMYMWIALICILVVAAGTFMPIRRYSKMPPKELLKIF